MSKPQFSLVMPVKNASALLEESLMSVFSQSYKNFEVIVVDDASTDNSYEIAKKFKCKIVRLKESKKAAYARNKGAERARGYFLVFMDSDIILPRNTFMKAKEYIEKEREVSAFIGFFSEKMRFNNLPSQYKHLYLCYYYLKQGETLHTLDTSLTFIKRGIFNKFKFNTKIGYISEDTDLGMRLTKEGHIIKQPRHITMEHAKYYSLISFFKTDFVRGKKFSQLFLKSLFKDKKESVKKTFYLRPINTYLSVGIMPLMVLSLLLSLFIKLFFPFFLLFLVAFIIVNFDFWSYLAKVRSTFFAFESVFIKFADVFVMDLGIGITALKFLFKRDRLFV